MAGSATRIQTVAAHLDVRCSVRRLHVWRHTLSHTHTHTHTTTHTHNHAHTHAHCPYTRALHTHMHDMSTRMGTRTHGRRCSRPLQTSASSPASQPARSGRRTPGARAYLCMRECVEVCIVVGVGARIQPMSGSMSGVHVASDVDVGWWKGRVGCRRAWQRRPSPQHDMHAHARTHTCRTAGWRRWSYLRSCAQ